jgi:hypothetical protein
MTETMSIHRALATIKTLDKRIEKSISNFVPLEIFLNGKLSQNKTQDDFDKESKAEYQSIKAMVQERNRIKAAIIRANATTIVTINNVEMSVAEAIDRKSSISSDKSLLLKMRTELLINKNKVDKLNESAQTRLDQLIEKTLSKESTKIKGDEYESIAKPFMLRNEATIVDPLHLQTLIKIMDEDIENFEREVDIVLSESNAQTLI